MNAFTVGQIIGALVPSILMFALVRWIARKTVKKDPLWACFAIAATALVLIGSINMGYGALIYVLTTLAWVPYFSYRDRKAAA